jgi:hypothetical protein
VPRQKNGFDCGLFTCRYAFGIYKLKDQSYTYEDVFKSKTPLLKKLSNNAIFLFNQKVVDEFRTQLGKLCDNLHHVYHYNKVPHPSIGVTRRIGATRKSAPGNNKKQQVTVEDAKSLDSAAELEYASPIIDLVRCNNRIVVPAPSVSEESVIPKVNLNAEVLQLEIKALVPNKPDVTTEQKVLEPVIDVKTEASKCEQKMLAQPLKSNNNYETTIKPIETNNEVGTTVVEPKLLEPATNIKPIETNNKVGTTVVEPKLLEPATNIKPIETNNKVGTTVEPKLLEPATDIKPIENNNTVRMTLEPKLPPATDIKPIETNNTVGTTLQPKALEITTSNAFVGRKVAASKKKRSKATLVGSDQSSAKIKKEKKRKSKKMMLLLQLIHL